MSAIKQYDAENIIKDGAKHSIKFEFCGAWGIRNKVLLAIDWINNFYPNQFNFTLLRDKPVTKRLEVTVYKSSK